MFYKIAQSIMFQMDPERAHNLAIGSLKRTANTPIDRKSVV